MVPILDLDAPDLAGRLAHACRTGGVCVATIPDRWSFDADRLRTEIGLAFDQDRRAKEAQVSPTGHPHRGWREFFDDAGEPTYERFSFARYDTIADARSAGVPAEYDSLFAHANVWPSPAFAAVFAGFRDHMSGMIRELLQQSRLAAMPSVTRSDNANCSVSRYHPRSARSAPAPILDHVDLSLMTVVWQVDGQPGLQVEDDDGRWHDVEAAESQVIVLCGEMLRMASDGAATSGRHRVRPPGGQPRETAICLYAPALDSVLAPPEDGSGEPVTVWSLVGDSVDRYMRNAATEEEARAWREGRPYVPVPPSRA